MHSDESQKTEAVPEPRKDPVAEAVQDEIQNLRQSAESLLFAPLERVFGLSALIVVGGLTLGFREERRGVLLVLPFVVAVLFGFLLQMNVEMLSRAGQKRALERFANRRLGLVVYVEEDQVAAWRRGEPRRYRSSLLLLQAIWGSC